jgi:hypothetical protein
MSPTITSLGGLSSAWAEYADALRGILFARLSSRTSRQLFQPLAFVRRQARPLACVTPRLLDASNYPNMSEPPPHWASWLVGVYGFL